MLIDDITVVKLQQGPPYNSVASQSKDIIGISLFTWIILGFVVGKA